MRIFPLLLILVCCLGCNSNSSGPAGSYTAGGLTTQTKGTSIETAKTIVVLLHGYGAPGSDMVGLEEMIDAGPEAAFVYPVGPFPVGSEGRAWWEKSGTGFDSSRVQVIELLKEIAKKSPEAKIFVGGFSQGGTLASNLVSAPEACHLHGVLLFSPSTKLDHPPDAIDLPEVFLSHGKNDQVLPFDGSVHLQEIFKSFNCSVTFRPFDEGHTLTVDVMVAAGDFIRRVAQVSPRDQ